MTGKLLTMREAVARFVNDRDVVAAEGFTHLIPFAAGHEMIRQRKKDLVLCRLTPDLIYDQMVAAGWRENSSLGGLETPASDRSMPSVAPWGTAYP